MLDPATTGQERLRDRPIGELLKQLSQQTSTLVRRELELAKTDMAEKGKKAGLGAGVLGGAVVAGLLAFGALTACIIAALATAMELWLAALIVAVAYAAVAGVLAVIGLQRLKEASPPIPKETQESVKEDVAWAKTRARSART